MDEIQIISQSDEENIEPSPNINSNVFPNKIAISRKLKRRLESGILVTDISSGSFKHIFLVKRKDKITVKHYGNISREDLGIVSEDPFDLYRAGMALFEGKSNIRVRDILVVSSNLDFFIRRLELPLSKKSEIERAARWEIDKKIPIGADDSYIKIRRDELKNGTCKLTVGAVPRRQINYWQFLDQRLIGVIPTPVALIPLGPPALSQDLSYCYIFYCKSLLNIGYYSSNGLQYQHPVVDETAETLFEKSDSNLKRSRIVDELANSMEIFYSRFPDKRVAGIILFMSSGQIAQLAPLISENIVIDVIPADFPENVEVDPSCEETQLDPEYFPLLGAARVESNDFIFLPKTLEDNIKNRAIRKTIYYGLTTGLVTILMLFLFLFAGVNISKSRLKNIVAQKGQIENSIAYKKSRDYLTRTNLMSALKKRFDTAENQSSGFYRALESLTPEKIYLNNLILKHEAGQFRVEISGYFEGDITRSDTRILDFMENLKFYGVDQIELRRLGKKLTGNGKTESFEITGRYVIDD